MCSPRPLKGSRLIGHDAPARLTVLCCRGAPPGSRGDDAPGIGATGPAGGVHIYDGALAETAIGPILAACTGEDIHLVGPRPGREIDPLLSGRMLVIGDDADLNAVVLRLLRKDLLGAVAVGYATPRRTPFTELYALPTGAAAVATARLAEIDLVPLVRSDTGGVLVGAAQLSPITGTFYVDEQRIVGGSARVIQVEPDSRAGLAVTVVRRRFAGFGPRPRTYYGRAVEFGILPGSDTAITYDGIRHPRTTNRWVFYRHTAPLRLIRGVY